MILQKLIILAGFLGALNADAALSNLDKSLVTQDNNMLTNPGFESGKAGWENVSGAGTYTVTSTAANVYQGGAAGSWDSSSASQVFRSSLISAAGRAGGNGVASCVFKSASGTATHTMAVHDNSGNVLASTSINATSSAYQRLSLNFPFGSITSARIVITSVASNEPELFIDSCFMGSAQDFNLSQVSQASFYGSLTYPSTTNCTWNTTSSSYADFSADSDCTASPTVSGGISAPATKIPAARALNLPAATYLVIASGEIGTTGGVSDYRGIRIFDGTTSGVNVTANNGTANGHFLSSIAATFTYTSVQSSVTFSIQGLSSGGSNIRVQNDGTPLTFQIYRFPLSSETAARVDALPASWSGYHDNTCSWSRTNTAYGDPAVDSTCNLVEQTNRNFGTVTSYLSGSDKLPGIVFTPSRAGLFLVLADLQTSGSAAGVALGFRLETSAGTLITEGSHLQSASSGNFETKYSLKGVVNATSTSALTLRIQCKAASGNCQIVPGGAISAISWSVISLDQSFPAPLLVNSVTSNSSGLERVERATLNCDSGSAITSQSGSWISSIGNISSGVCSAVIASGNFSSNPSCLVTRWSDGTSTAIAKLSARPTSTSLEFRCYAPDTNANATACDVDVVCMGPR